MAARETRPGSARATALPVAGKRARGLLELRRAGSDQNRAPGASSADPTGYTEGNSSCQHHSRPCAVGSRASARRGIRRHGPRNCRNHVRPRRQLPGVEAREHPNGGAGRHGLARGSRDGPYLQRAPSAHWQSGNGGSRDRPVLHRPASHQVPDAAGTEHDGAIDIPAGTRDYVVSDDLSVPLDLHVLAVYPHAHYLATLVEGYATLPDGTRRWLIRIPAWDLSWQGVYHLRQPLFLPRGSVISMRFHYDNSAGNIRNPHQPPVRVRGGSQADDEMGNLWLQVLPDAPGDQRLILQEAVTRRLLEKYPGDFTANFNMGDLLLNRNDATGAVPYFEAACRAEPRSALAATELGTALASASRFPEAIEKFHRALELDAAFVDARYNLASAEAASGQMESAVADFKKVLAARPDDGKARDRLGEVLFAWGDQLADSQQFEDAAARYREALQFRPGDAALHTNLGMVLARVARYSEARAEFEAALKINPELQPARNALAHLAGH